MDPHIRRKVIRNRKRRIKALIREHLRTAGLGHVQGINLIGQWSTRSNTLTTKLYEIKCQGCTGSGHVNLEISPERKLRLIGVRGDLAEQTCQQIQSRVVVEELRGKSPVYFGLTLKFDHDDWMLRGYTGSLAGLGHFTASGWPPARP